MKRIFTSLFLAALLAQTQTVLSQEATAEARAVGTGYVAEEYGDWSIRCITAPEGQQDQCSLYQLLYSADGAPVSEFSIFALASDGPAAAGATIVVPLETLLTEQLTMAVDGQNARVYQFSSCNAAGCVARIGFTQAEMDEMKRGISAAIRIVPAAAPDRNVVLDISLLGFTAGFEALSAR